MQIYLPYAKKYITQRFGANANYSYSRDGLKGHTAYDWGVPYGTKIPNCVAGYCYSVMHKDDPDPNMYRAVFLIVEDEKGIYEVSYGHCSAIYAQVGKTYDVGETLGLVGNTGDVFDGNHEVTRQEKINGSHAGAHLHGPQVRVLRMDTVRKKSTQYIQGPDGYVKWKGCYLAIPYYNNGYNGCISFAEFSTETLATDYKPILPALDDLQATIKAAQEGIVQLPYVPEDNRPKYLQAISDFLARVFPTLFK